MEEAHERNSCDWEGDEKGGNNDKNYDNSKCKSDNGETLNTSADNNGNSCDDKYNNTDESDYNQVILQQRTCYLSHSLHDEDVSNGLWRGMQNSSDDSPDCNDSNNNNRNSGGKCGSNDSEDNYNNCTNEELNPTENYSESAKEGGACENSNSPPHCKLKFDTQNSRACSYVKACNGSHIPACGFCCAAGNSGVRSHDYCYANNCDKDRSGPFVYPCSVSSSSYPSSSSSLCSSSSSAFSNSSSFSSFPFENKKGSKKNKYITLRSKEEYLVSEKYGFIHSVPLKKLAKKKYEPWESLIENMHTKYEDVSVFRDYIDHELDTICIDELTTFRELQRACCILSFLSHKYVWGGGTEDLKVRLPACLAVPWVSVCDVFGLPYVLCHCACDLWNWEDLMANKSENDDENATQDSSQTSKNNFKTKNVIRGMSNIRQPSALVEADGERKMQWGCGYDKNNSLIDCNSNDCGIGSSSINSSERHCNHKDPGTCFDCEDEKGNLTEYFSDTYTEEANDERGISEKDNEVSQLEEGNEKEGNNDYCNDRNNSNFYHDNYSHCDSTNGENAVCEKSGETTTVVRADEEYYENEEADKCSFFSYTNNNEKTACGGCTSDEFSQCQNNSNDGRSVNKKDSSEQQSADRNNNECNNRNYEDGDTNEDIAMNSVKLQNMRSLILFTGDRSEEWFYLIPTYIDMLGTRLVNACFDLPPYLNALLHFFSTPPSSSVSSVNSSASPSTSSDLSGWRKKLSLLENCLKNSHDEKCIFSYFLNVNSARGDKMNSNGNCNGSNAAHNESNRSAIGSNNAEYSTFSVPSSVSPVAAPCVSAFSSFSPRFYSSFASSSPFLRCLAARGSASGACIPLYHPQASPNGCSDEYGITPDARNNGHCAFYNNSSNMGAANGTNSALNQFCCENTKSERWRPGLGNDDSEGLAQVCRKEATGDGETHTQETEKKEGQALPEASELKATKEMGNERKDGRGQRSAEEVEEREQLSIDNYQRCLEELLKFIIILKQTIKSISDTLKMMYDECDPSAFYNQQRRFLRGLNDNSGMEGGLIYEGISPEHKCKYDAYMTLHSEALTNNENDYVYNEWFYGGDDVNGSTSDERNSDRNDDGGCMHVHQNGGETSYYNIRSCDNKSEHYTERSVYIKNVKNNDEELNGKNKRNSYANSDNEEAPQCKCNAAHRANDGKNEGTALYSKFPETCNEKEKTSKRKRTVRTHRTVEEKTSPPFYRGNFAGTNAGQSSLIHLIDILLCVNHFSADTYRYVKDMKKHMVGFHRTFLKDMEDSGYIIRRLLIYSYVFSHNYHRHCRHNSYSNEDGSTDMAGNNSSSSNNNKSTYSSECRSSVECTCYINEDNNGVTDSCDGHPGNNASRMAADTMGERESDGLTGLHGKQRKMSEAMEEEELRGAVEERREGRKSEREDASGGRWKNEEADEEQGSQYDSTPSKREGRAFFNEEEEEEKEKRIKLIADRLLHEYNECIKGMVSFRKIHLGLVYSYIVRMAARSGNKNSGDPKVLLQSYAVEEEREQSKVFIESITSSNYCLTQMLRKKGWREELRKSMLKEMGELGGKDVATKADGYRREGECQRDANEDESLCSFFRNNSDKIRCPFSFSGFNETASNINSQNKDSNSDRSVPHKACNEKYLSGSNSHNNSRSDSYCEAASEDGNKENSIKGTGGTNAISFLKTCENETSEATIRMCLHEYIQRT